MACKTYKAYKICYFDARSGVSGDMVVGALAGAGADFSILAEGLDSLKTRATFSLVQVWRAGVMANRFIMQCPESLGERRLSQMMGAIDASWLPDAVKQRAAAVLARLAGAWAYVHETDIHSVRLPETEAIGLLCDIVAACHALFLLGIERICSSPLNTGSGTVSTSKGELPIPTPTTARLLARVPCYALGPRAELTTPTGAALMSTLARRFGPMPPMAVGSSGYGAGGRDFAGHSNVLRAVIGCAVRRRSLGFPEDRMVACGGE